MKFKNSLIPLFNESLNPVIIISNLLYNIFNLNLTFDSSAIYSISFNSDFIIFFNNLPIISFFNSELLHKFFTKLILNPIIPFGNLN